MAITLNITDYNTELDEIRVYRSEAFFERDQLPPVLTTLAPDAVEYKDTTAVRNGVYYYRLGAVQNGLEVVSNSTCILATDYTGPGPQTLRTGDYAHGYFGTVAGKDFLEGGAGTLFQMLDLNHGTPQSRDIHYYKFAHQGKILFVPQYYLASSVSWNQLYDSGLVYGVDGPGPLNHGHDVNQNRVIQIGEARYRVRLLRGYNNPTVDLGTETDESELTQLLMQISSTVYSQQPLPKWDGIDNTTRTVAFHLMERSVDNTYASRLAHLGERSGYTGATSFFWNPVFELVY